MLPVFHKPPTPVAQGHQQNAVSRIFETSLAPIGRDRNWFDSAELFNANGPNLEIDVNRLAELLAQTNWLDGARGETTAACLTQDESDLNLLHRDLVSARNDDSSHVSKQNLYSYNFIMSNS